MNQTATAVHKKGKMAEGKVARNWRLPKSVVDQLPDEAERMGFGRKGSAILVGNILTRYFNGDVIIRNADTSGR